MDDSLSDGKIPVLPEEYVKRAVLFVINIHAATVNMRLYPSTSSMVTEMVKGKGITDAKKITQRDLLDTLGGLPEESEHCALLAVNTLKAAIRDCMAMKREPWKKAYRQH